MKYRITSYNVCYTKLLRNNIGVVYEKLGDYKNSCYDCHSNNTVYPWYASVAPVSWVVVNHVKEGRSELNFSEWANLDPKKAAHKLDECKEVIEEGEMPLAGYVALHAKAKLDETTKQALLTWINEQLTPQTPA